MRHIKILTKRGLRNESDVLGYCPSDYCGSYYSDYAHCDETSTDECYEIDYVSCTYQAEDVCTVDWGGEHGTSTCAYGSTDECGYDGAGCYFGSTDTCGYDCTLGSSDT